MKILLFRRRFLLAVISLWAFVLSLSPAFADGCGAFQGKEGVFVAAKNPKPVKDGHFTDYEEKKFKLSQLKGRALLVNFWTSWCTPCIREMPSMDRLQARFRDHNLTILPLTRDPGGTKSAAKFYLKHNLKNLPLVADRWGRITKANRIGALPQTMFIDAEGREVGRMMGGADWEDPQIIKLLADCLDVREKP